MKKEMMVANPDAMPEVVNSLMQFILRYNPDEEMIALAKELLACAKTDLMACKVLYEKKIYSESTYHLQQSAEKATKAILLNFGMFNKKDLYVINECKVRQKARGYLGTTNQQTRIE
jgi:hypothetical protein